MPEYTVQRFRGGYAIVHRDAEGKRHRRQLDATDKPTAEAEARSLWRRHTGASGTVGGIMAAYLKAGEEAGRSSIQRQRDAWKAMKHFWAKADPAKIDEQMARDYVQRRDRSASTTRYEMTLLSVALRWGVKNGVGEAVPDIWRPEAPERGERHISVKEFAKWFAQVRAPHARLYVELALATMARPTAILELTWPQIDWDHATVNLNPPGRRQTKKRRPIVGLDEETMKLLRTAHEGAQSDYIIERGGKKVANIKKAFQAASKRSGIHVTPYMLRHTGAVWAAERGTPMAELAQFMGHDDDATTQKFYARFTPTYLRGVSANLRKARNEAAEFSL